MGEESNQADVMNLPLLSEATPSSPLPDSSLMGKVLLLLWVTAMNGDELPSTSSHGTLPFDLY